MPLKRPWTKLREKNQNVWNVLAFVVRAAKSLTRLCECIGASEASLLEHAKSTKPLCTDSQINQMIHALTTIVLSSGCWFCSKAFSRSVFGLGKSFFPSDTPSFKATGTTINLEIYRESIYTITFAYWKCDSATVRA